MYYLGFYIYVIKLYQKKLGYNKHKIENGGYLYRESSMGDARI